MKNDFFNTLQNILFINNIINQEKIKVDIFAIRYEKKKLYIKKCPPFQPENITSFLNNSKKKNKDIIQNTTIDKKDQPVSNRQKIGNKKKQYQK